MFARIASRAAAAGTLALATASFLTLAASTAKRLEESRALAPGGSLIVDSDAGSVTIHGGQVSGAKIVVTSKTGDIGTRYDVTFEESAGSLKILCHKKESWSPSNWFRSTSMHFDVTVPADTVIDVRTGGGSIDISGLMRDARVRTSGGSIAAADLGGTLVASTSGGSLSFENITGDIQGQTSGGSIEVEEAHGQVDVQTSGGSVSVSFAPGNAKGGEIESSGGSIEVEVDPAANLTIDASTSGGVVQSDLPIARSGNSRTRISGNLGSGGAALRVHTSGGSVEISGRAAKSL